MKRENREHPAGLEGRVMRGVACIAALAGLAIWIGCDAGVGSGGALRELVEGQKKILERLDKIEAAQKQIVQAKGPQRARPTVDYDKVYDIQIGKSPTRGAKNAKATLVEFSDMQCPYSKRVQPTIAGLLEAYPNDFRHVYKNFPLRFHKRALPAAKACVAAGWQGKFWEMHNLVYENPRKLEDADLEAYAEKIGLDVKRFEKDMKSAKAEQAVEEDMKEATRVQVTGTPTLFLNGKRVRDRSLEGMKQQIQAILKAKDKAS